MSGVMTGWVSRQVLRQFRFKKGKNTTLSLQEVYLRDDIPCGSAICRICGSDHPAPLPSEVAHYVVPDANTLAQFWEVFELPQVMAVIFLASVLKEVRLQSNSRNWRRLRALYNDKRRSNMFFDDEHSIYTRLPTQRGVENFATWFSEHLGNMIPIIVITSSAEMESITTQFQDFSILSKKSDTTVKVITAANYFQEYWRHDTLITELVTSLIQSQKEMTLEKEKLEIYGNQKVGSEFPEHMKASALEEGLTSGTLRAGVLHVSKHASFEAFVRPSNKGEASIWEILISTRKLQNRALNGDLVAVRVISQKELKKLNDAPGYEGAESNVLNSEGAGLLEDLGDEVQYSGQVGSKYITFGEVVGILQRNQRDYVACLDDSEEKDDVLNSNRKEPLLCIPMNRKIPMVRVTSRQRSHLVGQRFVIRIDGWEAHSKIPRGHLVRVLGPIGELNTENSAILVENDINISPFSTSSLQEIPCSTNEHSWMIPEVEYQCRRDLRHTHRTCSIDPPGSKDVDDCLSVNFLSDNTLEVGVHIADVSYFVRQGGALDLEALARGTTVYLVGGTYHMLPSILSEDLCSLREGRERLAVSVIWTLDPEKDFEILNVWFGRTIIQSRHQMFYAQAQKILDGEELPEGWVIAGGNEEIIQLQKDLTILANFSQCCRVLRESQGALSLESTELQFDVENGKDPMHVHQKAELPMNWIVAELMIQANAFVANRIYRFSPTSALLRRHTPPKHENFGFLMKCCEARGFILDTSSNKALAASLERLKDSNDPTIENALNVLATRALSEAEYVSSGDIFDSDGFYHYGLALEFYTHFTSPIRRYADIIVHRMLIASLEQKSENSVTSGVHLVADSYASDDVSQAAFHLNGRHRASKRAEKECDELYLLMYFQKHKQAEHAVVIGIQPKGVLVFVPKYDLKGLVQLQDKNGHVILPAENDDMPSECNEGFSTDKYTLQYNEDIISIRESNMGTICYDYALMASIWVQIKANDSRAHIPTLQLRLLSAKHPAVISAEMENSCRDVKTKSWKLQQKVPTKWKDIGKQLISENKQTSKAMVQQVAAEQRKQKDSQMDISLQEKPYFSEDIDRVLYSASSLYFHTQTGSTNDPPREPRLSLSAADQSVDVMEKETMLAPSIAISGHDIEVGAEETTQLLLRKGYQRKLEHAARLFARRVRSTKQDNDNRQMHRFVKERDLQERAIKQMYNTSC